MTSGKRVLQDELRPQSVSREQARAMVFGATLARSLAYEDAATVMTQTAKAIWDNFETYFLCGEWPIVLTAAELAELDDSPGPARPAKEQQR